MKEQGIVIIYTGDGRGKTTASLGLCLRGLGWGRKVCVIQFFKSEEYACGEKLFFKENGLELYSLGIGFSWKKTPVEQRLAIQNAWEFAKQKLNDETYDCIVLDEILHVFKKRNFDVSDILSEQDLMDVLGKRPYGMDVVLTGRGASQTLIDFADMVTEMKCVKHPLEKGIQAKKGMEY